VLGALVVELVVGRAHLDGTTMLKRPLVKSTSTLSGYLSWLLLEGGVVQEDGVVQPVQILGLEKEISLAVVRNDPGLADGIERSSIPASIRVPD